MRLGEPGGINRRVEGTNPVPPGTAGPVMLRLRWHGKVCT
jgi:hypothetical protein